MSKIPFGAGERFTLEGLQSSLTGLLDRLWHCGVSTGPFDGQDFSPVVELRDEPERYVATVELPGVLPQAVDVSVESGNLVVSGEKRQAELPADSSTRVVQTERRYGCFRRTIRLPGPIEVEGVSASFANGVLEVVAPKAAGAAAVGIKVNVQVPKNANDGS